MAGIGETLKQGALAAGQGTAMLAAAGLKSVKVAGVAADKAVEITGKSVEVSAKLASAGLNTAGVAGEAALQTASVATQAAAKITQAAATATANAGEATLKASSDIVKSGVGATAKIANAALTGTTQITTDTLKSSADAASAGAKFSLGTVTSALKGLDNLRDLGGMTGQAWVEKVRARKQENSKLASMRAPQIVVDLLVKDFEKVAKDLLSSFQDTISSSDVSLKLLIVSIKDLYCMSFYRRMTKDTCPSNSTVRKNLEAKIKSQIKELDGRSRFFFQMFDQKQNQTISLFKAESQRMPPTANEQQELAQIERIKSLFTKKLDEFSTFVAGQLTVLTNLFEGRTAQYQKIIDQAYSGVFATNGIFNAPSGGRRRSTRKHKKRSKKTRRH
jgi:hypothetical protein